ncbi:MAG: hypothetical protein ABIR34_01495 [Marmoricola sp.]
MNDLPPDSRPVPPPDPDPTPTQAIPAQQSPDPSHPAASTKQGFQDRLWSLRAVIAVALASVIIGSLGGAALANVSQDGNDGRHGPGGFNRGGPGVPGGPGRPGMMNGGPQDRKQFPNRRGMGQRQWDEDGDQQGQPLNPAPSPKLP